ncbi:MAG: ABC transporter permease [Arcanobacterium sp.]|nr:ABC transporter permease [Arcanobacterium sp.]
MLKHIMKREVTTLLASKAQRISTVIIVGLILVAGFFGRHFLKDTLSEEIPQFDLGNVAVSSEILDAYPELTKSGLEIVPLETDDPVTWLEENGEKEDVTAAAVLDNGIPKIFQYGDSTDAQITAEQLKAALFQSTLAQAELTTPNAELLKIAQTNQTEIEMVGGTMSIIAEDPIGYIAGYVAQIILLLGVIMGLSTIAQGVVEEKSSRVVEILLSSVRPRQLLTGKILGIGIFVFGQILLYLATVVVALKISGLLDLPLFANFNLGSTLIWVIVWVVLGFFTFVTIAGAAASTVSRQEDLGAISGTLSFFCIIPFYLGVLLVPAQPDGILTKILSQLPMFGPFMMPIRQSLGAVTNWELGLAVAINLLAIPLLAALAGKIYENSILKMGSRLSIREALKG